MYLSCNYMPLFPTTHFFSFFFFFYLATNNGINSKYSIEQAQEEKKFSLLKVHADIIKNKQRKTNKNKERIRTPFVPVMSFNCFFGLEIHPDEAPVTPVIPPRSKLVITHCSITATHSPPTASEGSSSSSHHHHNMGASSDRSNANSAGSSSPSFSAKKQKKAAHETEEEQENKQGGGEQLLDGAVTLYVQSHHIPKQFAVCTLSLLQGITYAPLELIFDKQVILTLRKSSGGATGPSVAYPTVHLTGYYEEDDDDEEDDDEEDEDDDDDEPPMPRSSLKSKNQQPPHHHHHASPAGHGKKKRARGE